MYEDFYNIVEPPIGKTHINNIPFGKNVMILSLKCSKLFQACV